MSWESLWYGPRTWRALAAAPLLAPASWLYGAGVALRNATFSAGLRAPVRVEGATVVSVGNLVVGGAGKTPVTIFLARWAAACGRKVAVLSRGYGRRSASVLVFTADALPPLSEAGDEPRLIARRCPGVEVCVGPRRASLALDARERGRDFLLLDDGFQHRQLHRDVDLVVWSPPGNGHRLPWGPLREPLSALARASLVWTSDDAPELDKPIVRARSRLSSLIDRHGVHQPIASLRGRPVVLLLGIARPERVVRSVEAAGARVVAVHAHADHREFSPADVDAARAAASASGALLVTTEKDLERLPADVEAVAPRLELEVLDGLDALAHALGLDEALVPPTGG
ncbi:MAG: tetraacyldisaccharide 4'-kinase [Myxococcota bacterium]